MSAEGDVGEKALEPIGRELGLFGGTAGHFREAPPVSVAKGGEYATDPQPRPHHTPNTVLYRRPLLDDGERTVRDGLDPGQHAPGYAWLTFDEEYAQTYFVRGDGYVRFEMHPSFEEEFSRYRVGSAGGNLRIPWREIPKFNRLTLDRTWVPYPKEEQ